MKNQNKFNQVGVRYNEMALQYTQTKDYNKEMYSGLVT